MELGTNESVFIQNNKFEEFLQKPYFYTQVFEGLFFRRVA